MVDPEHLNRIPAAQSSGFSHWHLPEVAAGHIVPAASESLRREREREAQQAQRSLSAGELQEITRSARVEGYTAGQGQGLAEGRERGHAEGLAQGLAAGREQVEHEVARLKALQRALLAPIEAQRTALEQALHALVVELVRAVLGGEPSTDPGLLRQVVATALASLPQGAENIQLHLHPDDLSLLQREGLCDPAWQLLADPALKPGDCRVGTRHSLVDFTRETRLQQLLAPLRERLPSQPEDAGEEEHDRP